MPPGKGLRALGWNAGQKKEGGKDGGRKKKTIGRRDGMIMIGRKNGREETMEDRSNEAGHSLSFIE